MNIFSLIILSSLLVQYFLNLTANILNLKSLNNTLPDQFADLYNKTEYQKSQEYTKVKTKFGFITASFNLLLLISFWFSGGFNHLDIWVRGFNLNEIYLGLIYTGILMGLNTILNLPFSIYNTFVIEEKFGFNKTTPLTFVTDLLKGLLLAVLLGSPVLALIIGFFKYAGPYAWVSCWLAVTAFSMFLQVLAPTFIMPLFNKFTPLPDGELKEAIITYANSIQFPLQGIYIMDGSKRSSKSNAFFTGFGKFKRIALFDTLINQHTTPELVAVLAHEIGHYKKMHIQKNMVISILQSGVIFYLLSVFLGSEGLFKAFYMQNVSVYAGLIFFSLFFSPFDFVLSILMQFISRKHEYEADNYAFQTTGKPENLIQSLKKLSVSNLTNLTPHPFYVFLNYSHPPVLERIKALSVPK
jgi:STE24 endopeptidase